MRSLFCAVLFTASLAVPMTTKADPKVGDPPPLLKATKLLQAPIGTSLGTNALDGKVVVLEFWATWCGPCVLAIPHLNELAEKLKDKPVQFVSITSEDEATVEAFLTKKPINAWVALDADKAMKTAYAVDSIPHTVVLGKDGLIAAIAYPTEVTESFINNLLAGKSAPANTNVFKRVDVATNGTSGKVGAAPLFEVSVRPSAPENTNQSTYSGGQGNLRYSGYTVWKLLPEAFEGASQARVWTNTPLPEGRFDVTVRQPRGHTALEAHELLWQAMQSAFALTAIKTTNEVDVLLLRMGRTNGPGLTPPASRAQGFRTGIGKIEALNAPLELLAWTLEDKLNKPVIDETRITRHFDISLKWDEKRIGLDSNGFNLPHFFRWRNLLTNLQCHAHVGCQTISSFRRTTHAALS
jgi:uncharacterized protein (TIGR03435 family)